MKTFVIAVAVVLLLGSTVQAGWYGPVRGYAYYPAAPAYAYPAPVVAAVPQVVYAPVYAPAVVARPVVAAPVVVGPPAVVIRSKVYIPGRPVRNVVRAVVP